ncbi:MAG: methyltransferase [Saprospiraceae bacterium]
MISSLDEISLVSYFQFKRFCLAQSESVMKVSTDSRILGSFISNYEYNAVLDIGCGMGILSFMLSDKRPEARIVGIDSIQECIFLAQHSKSLRNQFEGIQFIHKDLYYYQPDNLFDLIISNPPYFLNQLKSHSDSRNQMRHTNTNFVDMFCYFSKKYLTGDGSIAIVLPYALESQWTFNMCKYGFILNELVEIKHDKKSDTSLVICVYRKKFDKLIIKNLILFESKDKVSIEFKELIDSF